MKRSILFIGARANQVPLIKKAKEYYRIVICEITEDTEGRYLADAYYCVEQQDVNCLVSIAKKENVSGVLTNSEPLLSLAEKVNAEIGLPVSGAKAVELLTNKCAMRAYLAGETEFGVKYQLCHSVYEAIDFYRALRKKAIIKPVDNSASRGVFTINNEKEILVFFSETQGYSKDKTSVLIEEFIEGIEFTIDGLMSSDGKHCSLAISQKKHYKNNENVACELLFSYYNDLFDYDELRKINNSIVELTGYKLGMTHAEYKFDGERFRLIELMGRGGGNHIASEIVPYLAGFDNLKAFIDTAIGVKCIITDVKPEFRKRCAVLKFFDVPFGKSGVVKNIEGLEVLKQSPQIIKYELFFTNGDEIKPAVDDSKRIGYYIACAESMDALKCVMDTIEKQFKIII